MSGILNIYLPFNVSGEARLLRYREQPVQLRLWNGTVVEATAELSIVADGDRLISCIGIRWAGQWYNLSVLPISDLELQWRHMNMIADGLVGMTQEAREA